jgi:hypothetical protein
MSSINRQSVKENLTQEIADEMKITFSEAIQLVEEEDIDIIIEEMENKELFETYIAAIKTRKKHKKR